MMDNILTYKGYWTEVKYFKDENILHGKIEGINDLVMFDSESLSDVRREFESAVDDYLAFCKEAGKEPEKPYLADLM